MPRTPLGLLDNDPAHAVMASNVEAWLEDTYDQSIRDAGGGGGMGTDVTTLPSPITPSNTDVANLAALNALVATINASGGSYFFPAGTYNISGAANPITRGCSLLGEGQTRTNLNLTSGGQLFKVGTETGAISNYLNLGQMTINVTGTPAANSSLIYLTNHDFFYIHDLRVTRVAGFLRLGTNASDVTRCSTGVVERITGNKADVAGKVIWCRVASEVFFQDIAIHGDTDGCDLGDGIVLEPYDPTADPGNSGCEGLAFDNCHIWSAEKTADVGMPRGVLIDYTNGNALNCWFTNCVQDWVSVAGVQIHASAGSNECRNMNFIGGYMNNSGIAPGLLINPAAGKVRDISVDHCRIPLSDNTPGITITPSGTGDVAEIAITNNKFIDKDSTNLKSACMVTSEGNFQFIGNSLRHITDGAVNVNTMVSITGVDADNFVITGNKAKGLNTTQFVNHPVYTTASLKRIVDQNVHPNAEFAVASVAGNIVLPDQGEYFIITGSLSITSITAQLACRRITLRMNSTAVLVDGSNLKLAGNFGGAANPDDMITLICDGVNWWETGRSIGIT